MVNFVIANLGNIKNILSYMQGIFKNYFQSGFKKIERQAKKKRTIILDDKT